MEQVLIEEEARKQAVNKEETDVQKRASKALKEVLKEIKKAIKKQSKNEPGTIDRKARIEPQTKKDLRQYGIDPEEIKQLDYSKLFSYLESMKQNHYQYGDGDYGKDGKAIDTSHELKEKASEFIRQMKIDKMTGSNRDYEQSRKSEAYFWFKLVHGKGITELLYDLSFT